MQPEHLDQSFYLAARLVENSRHDDALTVLRPLLECEPAKLV
jgi:cytochrome c-type biogenesis protein CcmH/NrfG